jgi:hypothetical protein
MVSPNQSANGYEKLSLQMRSSPAPPAFAYASPSTWQGGAKAEGGRENPPLEPEPPLIFNPQILPKTQRFLESRVEIDKFARYVTDSMIFSNQ